MSVIEHMIENVSPGWALKRKAAKMKLNMVKSLENSGYSESGASHKKKSLKEWPATSSAPAEDIDMNLHTLRQRSRSLFMESPVARSAIHTQETNVIGSGLVPKPKINHRYLGISREEAKEIETQIKMEFSFWSRGKKCDICGINNFYEMQYLAFSSWLLNGDAFALPIYVDEDKTMPYQLRISLVESDLVSTPFSDPDNLDIYQKERNGNRIINGVEINKLGTVVAYHICNQYPYEYRDTAKWERIPAYAEKTGNPNVLHIFNSERSGQYRGVPYLAPVIESIKQLTRYTEAELMAAVINGLFTVFVTTEGGTEAIDFAGEDDDEEESSDTDDLTIGNGLLNYLDKGEKIEIADAKRPNINFDGFVTSLCKYIGAALGIPEELMLKQFGKSYSASRAALLEAWKDFRKRRKWFADDFCQPVYELWLSEAVAKGRIHAPGFFADPLIKEAYCQAAWNGPAPGQLDPTKEVKAANLRVEGGYSTREREAMEINGSDFDDNIDDQEQEIKKMQEAGLLGQKVGGMKNA